MPLSALHYRDPSNCVLKAAGQNSYLHGGSALKQFLYVVEHLTKRKKIELVLVKMLDTDRDTPRAMEEVGRRGI